MPEDNPWLTTVNSLANSIITSFGWKCLQKEMETETMTPDNIYGNHKPVQCKCPKAARQKLTKIKCGACNHKLYIARHKINTLHVTICSTCKTMGNWLYV